MRYTKAVLSLGHSLQKEALLDMAAIGVKTENFSNPESYKEDVRSCIATIAYAITESAAKCKNYKIAFFPGEPIPKYASALIVFALFIALNVYEILKTEDFNLSFLDLTVSTSMLFYSFHPKQEAAANAHSAIQTFQAMLRSQLPNVKKWKDQLQQLVHFYLLCEIKNDQHLKRLNFDELFEKLLSTLLNTVE